MRIHTWTNVPFFKQQAIYKPMQHFRKSSYILLVEITVSLFEITEDKMDKRSAKSWFVPYNLNFCFQNFYFPLKMDFGKLKKIVSKYLFSLKKNPSHMYNLLFIKNEFAKDGISSFLFKWNISSPSLSTLMHMFHQQLLQEYWTCTLPPKLAWNKGHWALKIPHIPIERKALEADQDEVQIKGFSN